MTNRIARLILSAAVVATLVGCSSKAEVDGDSVPVPAPVGGAGGGGGGDGSGDAVATVPLTLGQEVEAKGDVVQDENGMFSLTRTYSLTLAAETTLQVRKTLANGNCGAPNGTFLFLSGEEPVADVTIDHTKDYGGRPLEVLAAPLAAGAYTVVAMLTLEQECKNMLFFYDFVIEAAP